MNKLPITPKQLEIIKFIHKYRFLNRKQIQYFLKHKEPRRIKSWLKKLYSNEYLNRIYSTKLKENTKPAIYYLATKSISILKTQPEIDHTILNRIYREKTRSDKFINRSIFIGNLAIYFHKHKKPNQVLQFFTKTNLKQFDYLPTPIPDCYTAIDDDKHNIRYFSELLDAKTPRFQIRTTIKKYFEYFESNQWQDNSEHQFPKILIFCPDKKTQEFIHKFIKQLKEESLIEITFYLANRDTIDFDSLEPISWRISHPAL